MDDFRDIVVEVKDDRAAQIETWLLGRGRIPAVLPDHPPGSVRYLVTAVTAEELNGIEVAGGQIRKRALSLPNRVTDKKQKSDRADQAGHDRKPSGGLLAGTDRSQPNDVPDPHPSQEEGYGRKSNVPETGL